MKKKDPATIAWENDHPFKHSKDRPGLTLTDIEVRCTMHPEARGGHMHLTFADTTVTITVDGKERGTISGCLGGCIELSDNPTGLTFTMDAKPLWNAFQAALVKHPDYERLRKRKKES